MQRKLEQFIKDNSLEFTEGRRNSDAVVICGYALYLGVSDVDTIKDAMNIVFPPSIWADNLGIELDRVFNFAKANNYGKWWEKEENRKTYKL